LRALADAALPAILQRLLASGGAPATADAAR